MVPKALNSRFASISSSMTVPHFDVSFFYCEI